MELTEIFKLMDTQKNNISGSSSYLPLSRVLIAVRKSIHSWAVSTACTSTPGGSFGTEVKLHKYSNRELSNDM